MKTTTAAWLIAGALSGCGTPPPQPPITVRAAFNEAQTRSMLEPGSNTIKGSGFLRQQGGGVVTCAGEPVRLIPATDYSRERIRAVYGEARITRTPKTFTPDPPAFGDLQRRATCNAQGQFTFDRVRDGEYFLVTGVAWTVGSQHQGGAIYAPVQVRGGETVEVAVTAR
jgi:hypothetical protein